MAIKINLLPSEKAVEGDFKKLSGKVRNLNVILLSLFLILGIGIAIFLTLSSFRLRSLEQTNASLKDEVRTMESTEQKLVLLKDRLSKIKTVRSAAGMRQVLASLTPLISQIDTSSKISELTVSPEKTDLSVSFGSMESLISYLNVLKSSESFKFITLSSFSFNPATGYQISVKLANKI